MSIGSFGVSQSPGRRRPDGVLIGQIAIGHIADRKIEHGAVRVEVASKTEGFVKQVELVPVALLAVCLNWVPRK